MDSPTLAITGAVKPAQLATVSVQRIPRVIHQLWKTEKIPRRWRDATESVRQQHQGWEYRLWTDSTIDRYVRDKHPDFYPVFNGFNRNIMRADVFRYILMNDIGGLYCDLDYRFLRPYDYNCSAVVLSLECDKSFGDPADVIANYFFASGPQHPLWRDILTELTTNPPKAESYLDVCDATGPGLVTRVYQRNKGTYHGILLTPKPVFSPMRVHGRYEHKIYRNSGITYGYHIGSGTWKDRWSREYLQRKLLKLLRHNTKK